MLCGGIIIFYQLFPISFENVLFFNLIMFPLLLFLFLFPQWQVWPSFFCQYHPLRAIWPGLSSSNTEQFGTFSATSTTSAATTTADWPHCHYQLPPPPIPPANMRLSFVPPQALPPPLPLSEAMNLPGFSGLVPKVTAPSNYQLMIMSWIGMEHTVQEEENTI